MFCDMCGAETRCLCICDNKDSFVQENIERITNKPGYEYNGKTRSGYKFTYTMGRSRAQQYFVIQKCELCGGKLWKRKWSKSTAHKKCRNAANVNIRVFHRMRNAVSGHPIS